MKFPIIHWTMKCALRILGIWPNNSFPISKIILCSSFIIMFPFQLQAITKIVDNVPRMMDGYKEFSADLLLVFKFIIMWYNQGYIYSLMDEIVEDWQNMKSSRDQEIMMKYAKYANKCCIFNSILIMTTMISYNLVCFLIYLTQPVDERVLIIPTIYPFDHHPSPVFEIIFIFQNVQVFLSATSEFVSPSLLVTLVCHVGGKIDILLKDIDEISIACNSSKEEDLFHMIKNLVYNHRKLIEMTQKVEAAYSFICLVQFFMSTAVICFTGFVIMNVVGVNDLPVLVNYILFIVFFLWQAFTFSFAGEFIVVQSSRISQSICYCSWYGMTPKNVKLLIMVMMRTQQPMQLTVGKFTTLSIASFMQIVKTSASYLSVLRARYGN